MLASRGHAADLDHHGQWIFTQEALAQSREQAHDRAIQILGQFGSPEIVAPAGTAAGPDGSRAPSQALSIEEGITLVHHFLKLVPKLCNLAGAPSDVCWSAIAFYHRFYAVRSPMEFEMAAIVIACVHIACKIEERHDITLDALLEASDLKAEMKSKVHGLELDVLEAIQFRLLIEPKPRSALMMLIKKLEKRRGNLVTDGKALLSRAQNFLLELVVRTDTILLWPTSVIIAAALRQAIEGHLRIDENQRATLSEEFRLLLVSELGDANQQASMWQLVNNLRNQLRLVATGVDNDEAGQVRGDPQTRDLARRALKCNRIFESLRDEVRISQETIRVERKRRCSEVKASSADVKH